MPEIDSLVRDIYSLFDENINHEPSEENLDWVANSLKEMFRSRLSSREREASALRFSSLGRKDRQLWYAQNKPEVAEPLTPKTYAKFMYGEILELMLLFLAKEAGHEVTHLQEEVETDGILGHIDAIVDGVLVDVKSASPYSYKKFVSGEFLTDDPFGYLGQIGGYREVLGTDRAGFLVADKVSGDFHFAEVDSETLSRNKPAPRISHLKQVLASEVEPPRCYEDVEDGKSGNRKLSVSCSYCPYKFHCHRDANGGEGLKVYAYASGPRFLTRVVKEPKVDKDGW